MNESPKVSVICPSYNHGRHVGDFLRSMLAQTDARWELIIIDDASTDDNVTQISRFDDPRIRLIARKHNRGVAAGMNEGVSLARAEIVAFIASDDLVQPEYVERVIQVFAENPGAVAAYVSLERIDEQGASLKRQSRLPADWNRHELLRKSFLGPNPLPSPGMSVRLEIARAIPVPEGVAQYSDWIWNNRILMRDDVILLGEQLVRYRVSASSLCYRSVGSLAREMLETRVMMDDFLGIKDMDFLAEVFPEEMTPYRRLPPRHLPYVLGRLALLSDIPEKRCWGYETIMRHLSEPGVPESLQKHAGFTYKDLMALVPTEAASLSEEARRLRRRVRHLRRWLVALVLGLAVALATLFR
jgi:glycosyltransferase involved in cell wall biosynthesis